MTNGILEIVCLCDDECSARCVPGIMSVGTNSLQQRLSCLWRQFTSSATQLDHSDELLEEDVEGRYWKIFRHRNRGTRWRSTKRDQCPLKSKKLNRFRVLQKILPFEFLRSVMEGFQQPVSLLCTLLFSAPQVEPLQLHREQLGILL